MKCVAKLWIRRLIKMTTIKTKLNLTNALTTHTINDNNEPIRITEISDETTTYEPNDFDYILKKTETFFKGLFPNYGINTKFATDGLADEAILIIDVYPKSTESNRE